MTTRYSYGESRLASPDKAVRLARDVARNIGEFYEDGELVAAAASLGRKGKSPRLALASCCDVEAAVRTVSLDLARKVVWWGTLVATLKGEAAVPVVQCALWKVERLTQCLMALEEGSLEGAHLSADEAPGPGREVIEIEVRP